MEKTVQQEPLCNIGDADDIPQEDAPSACDGAPWPFELDFTDERRYPRLIVRVEIKCGADTD